MAKDWYPAMNEISWNQWNELKQKAEKAQMQSGPYAEPKVEIPASVLLRLLEMTKGMVR